MGVKNGDEDAQRRRAGVLVVLKCLQLESKYTLLLSKHGALRVQF